MRGARTLVVLRHSKAANPIGVADRDRPLSDRGRRDAAAAGRLLAEAGLAPDLVLCSPALRTRQTLEELAFDSGVVHDFDRRLYSADVETLFQVISEVPDEVRTVLLVGHNPAVHQLVHDLTGGAPEGFPTTALAVLRFAAGTGTGTGDDPGWPGVRFAERCLLESLSVPRG